MQPITDELIQEIKNRIVKGVHPEKIILFGSYAYGIPTKESDIDLCVILQTRDEMCEMHRIRNLLHYIDVPIEIHVYTPQHVERYNNAPSEYLIPTIINKGKVLFINNTSEKPSWFKRLIELCKMN